MRVQTQNRVRSRKNQPPPRPRTANGRKRQRKRDQSVPGTTIRKRGNVYYLFHKERRRIPWRIIIALFLVFLGGVGSAISYAQIHRVQRDIRLSINALTAQEEINFSLMADTTERYTHEEIERRARELGLGEPDPSQIIYFYAPRYSHVVIANDPLLPQENYFWQGIMDFINGIIGRKRRDNYDNYNK